MKEKNGSLYLQALKDHDLYDPYVDYQGSEAKVLQVIEAVIDMADNPEEDIQCFIGDIQRLLAKAARQKAAETYGYSSKITIPLWIAGVADGEASVWFTQTDDGDYIADISNEGYRQTIAEALRRLATLVEEGRHHGG